MDDHRGQRGQVDGAQPRRLLEHERARRAAVAAEQPERDDRPQAVARHEVNCAVEAGGDAVDERVEVQDAVAADVARVTGQVDRRHAPAPLRQRRADAPPRLGQGHDAVHERDRATRLARGLPAQQ